MRISDWSSDVCSSDLVEQIGIGEDVEIAEPREHGAAPAIGDQRDEGRGRCAVAVFAVRIRVDTVAALVIDDHLRLARRREGDRVGNARCVDERSEEHTSELQSLMRISYAVFCLKKKSIKTNKHKITSINNQ